MYAIETNIQKKYYTNMSWSVREGEAKNEIRSGEFGVNKVLYAL